MKKTIQRYINVSHQMTTKNMDLAKGINQTLDGLQNIIDEEFADDSNLREMDLIQVEHWKWTEKNFPGQVADDCFLGVVEEVGELAHADLKKKQGIRGDAAKHDADARDAVGDIMIYLMGYCSKREWKMSEVLQDTWEKVVSKRDWKKYPVNGIDK